MKGGTEYTERTYDRYRIRSTRDSSAKFGPCEVCGKDASEVFILNHQIRYEDPEDGLSWTQYGRIAERFGHKVCLQSKVNEFSVPKEDRVPAHVKVTKQGFTHWGFLGNRTYDPDCPACVSGKARRVAQ